MTKTHLSWVLDDLDVNSPPEPNVVLRHGRSRVHRAVQVAHPWRKRAAQDAILCQTKCGIYIYTVCIYIYIDR